MRQGEAGAAAIRGPGALLASTAFSAGVLAALLGDPQNALAACTVTSNPNSVTCAANTTTTNTTNTDAGTASSSDGIQSFTANGNVTATVNNNVTVDGEGLAVKSTESGSAVSVTSSGTIAGGLSAQTSGPATTTVTVNGGSATGATGGSGVTASGTTVVVNANGGSIAGGTYNGLSLASGISVSGTDLTVNVAGGTVSSSREGINASGANIIINITAGSVSGANNAGIVVIPTVTADITIGAGTTVSSANQAGIVFVGSGSGTTTVLGTLSAPAPGARAALFSGTLNIGNGGTTGTVIGDLGMNNSTDVVKFNRSDSYTYDGAIGVSANRGNVEILGGGTATFTSINNGYAGTTTVTGSGLIVNGSILRTSALSTTGVSTLGVGASNSNTVTGNLVLSAAGNYQVFGTTTFGRMTVGGTASLDGKIIVTTAANSAIGTYTLLTATGGFVSGHSTFSTTQFVLDPNSAGKRASISYDATHVFLTLSQGTISVPSGAGGNQTQVANGINNAINGGGNPTTAFNTLLNLSGDALTSALSQTSGVSTGGVTQGATHLTTSFLTTVLSPASGGGPNSGSPGALGFAREIGAGDWALSPVAAQAYAAVTPRARQRPRPEPVPAYAPGITMWGQAYGGYNKINGDATAGTSDTTARAYGLATGFDYRVRYDLVLGFAIAGGSTNWGLSQNLGGGKSDVFQVGFYGVKKFGAGYVSGAVSYALHDVTTDRTVTVAGTDRLQSQFNAHSFGARVEGGYRFAMPGMGVTPYAALQVQSFRTPSHSETAVTGSNTFALAYDAGSTTVTRVELGSWFDRLFAVPDGSTLAIRTRVAWANDHSNGGNVSALFQTLPGSNFSVNGAKAAPNSALLSAAADWRLASRVTVGARLDSEFASHSQTYAGTGRVAYAW